jgi:hypothetical protein
VVLPLTTLTPPQALGRPWRKRRNNLVIIVFSDLHGFQTHVYDFMMAFHAKRVISPLQHFSWNQASSSDEI